LDSDATTTTTSNDKMKNLKKKLKNDEELNAKKERRLNYKVLSNRLLVENSKVQLLNKDPFFDDEKLMKTSDIPFVSPFVQSKWAFKAVLFNDTKLLKSLMSLNNEQETANINNAMSVHVGKCIYTDWIPAQYALYLGNKKMLDLLIDNYIELTKNQKNNFDRVNNMTTMFHRFTTGNQAAFQYTGYHGRRLTESRGAKEGNNAFIKDEDLTSCLTMLDVDEFFKRLFVIALEYGSSVSLVDYLIDKYKLATKGQNYYGCSENYLYDHIITAILFGHRKLAAHLISLAPPGHGFNAIHTEVLNADNEAELKCQLRSNMCTKKPYANDQLTPIHAACINPSVKYLKTLLAITQDINSSDKRGRKPIHYASVCEVSAPLEYLITRISPYEQDTQGNMPLHMACLAGRAVNVETLLSHARAKGDNDSAVTTDILMDTKYGVGGINKPNRRGMVPLHLAISRNNYDCVKVLLKYGCNLEYPLSNSMGKITPLMFASQKYSEKVGISLVQALIKNGAKVEARDRYKRTALLHAAMCGHSRTVSYLLRLGAQPNAADSSGNTALHYACAYGWYTVMTLLIDAGAKVNVSNDWRLTPFGVAFLKGHTGICDQLLKIQNEKLKEITSNNEKNKDDAAASAAIESKIKATKIDINFRTDEGETLVMLCVSNSNLNEASVKQLIYIVKKLNGNCELVDSKGQNAFHYLTQNKIVIAPTILHATRNRTPAPVATATKADDNKFINEQKKYRLEMANILIEANCNYLAENNEMETPLFTAIQSDNFYMAKYLLETTKRCKINSKQNITGKTILSLLAEKSTTNDKDFDDLLQLMISYDGNDKEQIDELKKMAKLKDSLSNKTPFQIACSEINKKLTAKNQKEDKLSSITKSFLKFLYTKCESNPNAEITVDTVNTVENVETVEKEKKENYASFPIFDLIHNKTVDLINELISARNSSTSIEKINFSICDKDTGLTPPITACINGQEDFLLNLINLISNDDTIDNPVQWLAQQIAPKDKYLNENILQLCVRHRMARAFEAIIQVILLLIILPYFLS
jgi:ankyrin repeat protein